MNPLESERLRMQAELDALRIQHERTAMGQFTTPSALALEILRSARSLTRAKRDQMRFLDPAFSTGSFYSALLRVFPHQSIAAAYGFEIDPHYGAPASKLWEATGLLLKLTDFTVRRPGVGGAEEVDLLVCNPPYVRHHTSSSLRSSPSRARQCRNSELRVSGLAGLYVCFMLLSHKWLAADSLSIWLIPSEFMDVNYGSALKTYLLNHVDLHRIHRFDPSGGQIRRNLIKAELVDCMVVDCMVALPGQLFDSTQIPACPWFSARGRERHGEVLFVDARKLGRMVDRTYRELTGKKIARIANTYHAWRTHKTGYADVSGFCKSASMDEIHKHSHVLTPGRYVGVKPQEEDDKPFEEKMKRLVPGLHEQQAEGARLDAAITKNLEAMGFLLPAEEL